MDAPTARFTDRMGLLFETDGFPRIAGRIFGLLLLRESASSLNDLAATLGVSKASVSTNARLLAAHGMIERIAPSHDRRDYYRLTPDLVTRMLEQRLARWRSFAELVAEGRRAVPVRSPRVRRRLAECQAAYTRVTDVIGSELARRAVRR